MKINELEIITDNYSIYHGDCLEVMDKLIEEGVKVDAIITDPPYGIEFKSNYRKEKYNKIKDSIELIKNKKINKKKKKKKR